MISKKPSSRGAASRKRQINNPTMDTKLKNMTNARRTALAKACPRPGMMADATAAAQGGTMLGRLGST